MNAYLTNSINGEVYVFQVSEQEESYSVCMFYNENKELINTQINKCGYDGGPFLNEGDSSVLYEQIINFITENWDSLVPTQSQLISFLEDSVADQGIDLE